MLTHGSRQTAAWLIFDVRQKMKPTSAHSFDDAEVLDWRLSDEALYFEVSNVNFDGRARGRAKLTFPLIKPIRTVSFDATSNTWMEEPQVEALKSIRVLNFKLERHYSLQGIGASSGKHLSLGILSSEAQISW